MNPPDLERLLRESLKTASESFEPRDVLAAQEEFRRRRLRRRIGWAATTGLATTAAVVAAFVVIQPAERRRDEVQRTPIPVAVATGPTTVEETVLAHAIEVGEGPSGITVAQDAVWIANSGDGTISRIDIETGEEEVFARVGGEPDDVAVTEEAVWVSDLSTGNAIPVQSDGTSVGQPVRVADPNEHIDIAALPEGPVWTVSGNGSVLRFDGDGDPRSTDGIDGSDIAVTADAVWVFDAGLGSLTRLEIDGNTSMPATKIDAGVGGPNGDLAATTNELWITSPDTSRIVVVDPRSLEVIASIPMKGDYAGVALGRDFAWVVVGPPGRLIQIDADNHAIVQETALRGAYDVAISEGSVWVVNRGAGTVTRIPTDDGPAE